MTIAILTPAQVVAGLPTLRASAVELEANIHQYAVSTLDHCREHGDYRGAVGLLNALPKGQRVQAVAAWFREFSSGKLALTLKDGAWGAQLRGEIATREADFRVAESMLTTYADFTKEVAPKALTMAKFLASIERVANDTSTLPNGARKVPEAVAEVAAAMIAGIRAQKAA
jgi:hypothetical protein